MEPTSINMLVTLIAILLMVSIPILIIALGVSMGLRLAHKGGTMRETPLDILKARYARGEISKQQFEEMKRDLNDTTTN